MSPYWLRRLPRISKPCAAIAHLSASVVFPGTMDVVTGRSTVATRYGIVAASQPLAARAGVQVLERGGNAIDAAIAANAVLSVVEPQMNGPGGDLFAIVSMVGDAALHGLNAAGWAPQGLTPAY